MTWEPLDYVLGAVIILLMGAPVAVLSRLVF